MAKAWTDKTEYRKLSASLGNADRYEYFYRAKPLLQILWPNLKEEDLAGKEQIRNNNILLFVEDRENQISVIQLTYLSSQSQNIDAGESEDCIRYITDFERSNASIEQYIVIHNRDGRDNAFRKKLQTALDKLEQNKIASKASILSRELFLREVFDRMTTHLISLLPSLNKHTIDSLTDLDIGSNDIIREVPVSISSLTINPYRLVSRLPRRRGIIDMTIELTKNDRKENRMSVLIGQAGYGKSTIALRAISANQPILYIHAATVAPDTSGTKQLLTALIDLDKLCIHFNMNSADERQALELIVRPVIEYILKDEETNVMIVFDALDESALLARKGGIQRLFNLLKDIQVPVILIARAEFWHMRLKEFETEFGMRGTKKLTKNTVNLYELLPWTDDIIMVLADRYRQRYSTADPSWARLTHFIELVSNGGYKTFYGDIPQRPLFLRFVLETVAETDMRKIGRAALFAQWAQMKILRDSRFGQRDPILPNEASEPDIVTLAFDIMSQAAYLMSEIVKNMESETSTIELLNSIPIIKLRASDARFKDMDVTNLFLKSLLVPTEAPKPGMPVSLRFAHRAYQEYFLARHIVMFPNLMPPSVLMPVGLSEWFLDIQNEMR